MLRIIVFLCGAALMALELVAARLLAPWVGNSIYVWGSVITSVMVALSVGYWAGGHAADRFEPSRVLPLVISGAAAATTLVPPVASAVLPWASELGPRAGALAGATVIFFVPSVLLAMVSPVGVRIAAAKGMEHVGRSAGGLYAVSTAGSIVGTLSATFWLIPALSLEPLIAWTGLLLGATALLALPAAVSALTLKGRASANRASAPTLATSLALVTVCVAVALVALLGGATPSTRNELGEVVLFRADTLYHRLAVTEDAVARHLRFDRSHQSGVYLDDPYRSAIAYPDYLHLALAVKPDARRVLVLGLGGATVVKRMWRDYPRVRIDAVEIDPVVVDVAGRYFGLPDDPARVRVFTEDARRYVRRTEETYDIVIVDTYYADGVPFHLTTAEFFGEVDRRLARDGVVAYNIISSVDGPRSRLFRSLYRTAGAVWDRLWVFPIGLGDDGETGHTRNIVLLATDARITQADLLRRIETRLDGRVTIPGFEAFGADLHTATVRMSDVPELTDAHAPADSLIKIE